MYLLRIAKRAFTQNRSFADQGMGFDATCNSEDEQEKVCDMPTELYSNIASDISWQSIAKSPKIVGNATFARSTVEYVL